MLTSASMARTRIDRKDDLPTKSDMPRTSAAADRRRIGLVAYDGANALDIAGPMEAFNAAGQLAEGRAPYELRLLTPTGAPARTSTGLTLVADAAFAERPGSTR